MMKFLKSLLLSFFVTCTLSLSGVFGYSQALQERFDAVGISLTEVEKKLSLSRYEVARLLNVIVCEDCLIPSTWMQNMYNQQFWTVFSSLPDFNFRDIGFQNAYWNKKNYYYCVAYVADQDYFRGYPTVSSLVDCKNKFCGSQMMTRSEFFQALLNLVDDKLYVRHSASRKEIKSWLASLSKTSYAYQTLTTKDIQTIQNIPLSTTKVSQSVTLQSLDEFNAYLKYCMFNLQSCGFQELGGLKQGWWPIAELNVLFEAGFITQADVGNLSSSISGKEVLRLLDYLSQNFVSCTMNTDYDCDGIENVRDNCPHTYNLNQMDSNGNGVGDVCDEYLFGAGKKVTAPLVDDNGYVIIKNWDASMDPNLLKELAQGFGFFITMKSLGVGVPYRVSADAVADTELTHVQWDMGDGKTYFLPTTGVSHTYSAPGYYVISAVGTNKAGKKAEASIRIYLAPSADTEYAFSIHPSFTFKTEGVEYHFQAQSSGKFDSIVWSVNNQVVKGSLQEMRTLISQDGVYYIRGKAYVGEKLVAVAETTVIHGDSPVFSRLQVQNTLSQSPVSASTLLVGKKKSEVISVQRNRGDGTMTFSTGLTSEHQYQSAGLKTLQQYITFSDGTKLLNIASFFVKNPLTMQSLALNISGSLTYYQQEPLALGVSFFPSAPLISSANALSQASFPAFYDQLGRHTVSVVSEVNRCVELFTQGQVYVTRKDVCLEALIQGTLGQFTCDLDGDKIPDLCDDDIDGDGKPNLLGLITHETADCSFTAENVNVSILKKHFGVCSLDNCPFTANEKQTDLNNNGVGDVCEDLMQQLLRSDDGTSTSQLSFSPSSDEKLPSLGFGDPLRCGVPLSLLCGDGRINEGETCVTCPEDVGPCTAICGNGTIDPGETCDNCPEDVGPCATRCGNGIIDPEETCDNCPEDVGPCVNLCGNGVVDPGETCDNCPQDLRGKCVTYCGNGVVEEGEECDHGQANGKDGECSAQCKTIVGTGKPGGGISVTPCLSCPCLFTDFVGGLLPTDRIRAKLWDTGVVYGFSPTVSVGFSFNM